MKAEFRMGSAFFLYDKNERGSEVLLPQKNGVLYRKYDIFF